MKITKEQLQQVIKEEIEAVLEKKDSIQVTKLKSGHYRFFDKSSKMQGLYTKDGEKKSGDLSLGKDKAEPLIKKLNQNEAVLNEEEEIQYVRNDDYVANNDASYRLDRCMSMRRNGRMTEWVIRNEKGEVVPQGADGKGRCEWVPGRKPRAVPDHSSFIRENLLPEVEEIINIIQTELKNVPLEKREAAMAAINNFYKEQLFTDPSQRPEQEM